MPVTESPTPYQVVLPLPRLISQLYWANLKRIHSFRSLRTELLMVAKDDPVIIEILNADLPGWPVFRAEEPEPPYPKAPSFTETPTTLGICHILDCQMLMARQMIMKVFNHVPSMSPIQMLIINHTYINPHF